MATDLNDRLAPVPFDDPNPSIIDKLIVSPDRLRRSMSLKAIGEDPALADADTVDDVLSNYGITRLDGNAATGEMTIVVSTDVSTVIPLGQVFVGNGVEFVTTDAYIGRPSTSSVIVDTERLLEVYRSAHPRA